MMGSMGDQKRNLDETTSTMDVLALNNLVVSMRPLVKRVRIQVINKLTHLIKKYKSKKGTDAQVLANEKRADRLVDEIHTIKSLKADQIAKQSLANKQTLQEATVQADLRTRAFVRLATHKQMQNRVEKFRTEHKDWKALAAFILSKNTGRRMKKKKKKKKNKEDGNAAEENAKKSPSLPDEQQQEEISAKDNEKKCDVLHNHQSEHLRKDIEADVDDCISTDGDTTETDDDSGDGDGDSSVDKDVEAMNKFTRVRDNSAIINKKQDSATSTHEKHNQEDTRKLGVSVSQTSGPSVMKRADVIKRQDKEMVVKVFDVDDPDSLLQLEPSSIPILSVQNTTSSKDSFFLTASDSEGDEDNNVEENEQEDSSDVFVSKLSDQSISKQAGNAFNNDSHKGHQFGRVSIGKGCGKPTRKSSTCVNQGIRSAKNHHPTHGSRSGNKATGSGRGAIPETLHPSWEASRKRKLQTSVLVSHGKKTLFDDE